MKARGKIKGRCATIPLLEFLFLNIDLDFGFNLTLFKVALWLSWLLRYAPS